ncbi:MAG: ATP-binding protein [Patescibacteria group bacterium]
MERVKKKLPKKFISCTEDKIGTILNSIGEAVVTLDRQYKIKTFNPVAETLTGFKCAQVIGISAQEILILRDEKTNKNAKWPFADAIRKGSTIKLTNHYSLIAKDKREIPITFNISPLRDVDSSIIGLILVFRDVTKEREVQKMKSEFVSIVSHQLRTPSSAVKWYLETMLENRRGNKMNHWQVEHLEQAYQSNERMINLINDLLNVSRIESGHLKMDFQAVSLADVFSSVIKEMENFARANNVEIDCQICKNKSPLVYIDQEKVRQVIQNLVNNAIKYTKGKQRVVLNAKKQNNMLKVWVRDHGIGVPKDQEKHMFERFFRADNAITSQTEGSGLGLYIAKKILALHKGDIWLESKEGQGSTFYFTLPLAKISKKTIKYAKTSKKNTTY